uniref:Uncharacterized protein n=1 Tax=Fagus sylvatica TaxID=28930 RepID=A0A2N9IR65_FAGSY
MAVVWQAESGVPGAPQSGRWPLEAMLTSCRWVSDGPPGSWWNCKLGANPWWIAGLPSLEAMAFLQKGSSWQLPSFRFPLALSKDWSHWVWVEILGWEQKSGGRSFPFHGPLQKLQHAILGEHSLSNIKQSAAEEETAAVLKKQSSTKLSGWPSFFINHKDAPVRRAAFIFSYWLGVEYLLLLWDSHPLCFPLAPLFLVFTCTRLRRRRRLSCSDLLHQTVVGLHFINHKLQSAVLPSYCIGVDDYRSLSYLSTVNPGFLPIMSATGVSFIPYYPQRPSSRVVPFARWGGVTKLLLSVGHRKPLVSNPYLTPPSQSAISYANSQKLGFAMGAYGIASREVGLPKPFICQMAGGVLLMSWQPSAPNALEAEESTTALVQGSTKSAVAPPKRKTRAGKESKSTPSYCFFGSKKAPSIKGYRCRGVCLLQRSHGTCARIPLEGKEESIAAPVRESVESTVAPSKPKNASPPKQTVKKAPVSAASRPPRGQARRPIFLHLRMRKNRLRCQLPRLLRRRSLLLPCFLLVHWSYEVSSFSKSGPRVSRSKSGPRVARGSGGSGGDMVVVEWFVAEDDVVASPSDEDAPKAAAVLSSPDQTEDLGKSRSRQSRNSRHVPDSVPEEQIVFAECTADDDMPEDDDSTLHWMLDADADSVLSDTQTVLTTGPDASIAHIMEGISLFGVAPSLRVVLFEVPAGTSNPNQSAKYELEVPAGSKTRCLHVPIGGFVISASHLTNETPPFVGGALMLEGPHAQGLVESEPVVDLAVGAIDHDVPAGDTGASAADTLAGSDHLENIGVDDAVHVSEEIDEVGITGESLMRGHPILTPSSSFGLSMGPLVPFGDFWVPNDCSPYLSRLSAGHSDFTKGFKLSIGLGGPMMSLLGSVLAAMDESSLEDVTKTQILAWRSVIQDLMDVGFDLGFMMERLRQMAQCLFGKRLADEIKALQHQIALLQDSLAELTAYQDAMMSTGGVVPRPERGGSFLDSLLD